MEASSTSINVVKSHFYFFNTNLVVQGQIAIFWVFNIVLSLLNNRGAFGRQLP